MNAWLPEALKKYPVARKVLGVLLPPYWKNGMKVLVPYSFPQKTSLFS